MKATLDGLEFIGDESAATYTIFRDGLKGWFDGPGIRRENIGRPSAHGLFDIPGYLGGRVVSLAGFILADTVADFEEAMLALSGLLADGSSAELSVEQGSLTLTAMVRRHDAPDIIVDVYGQRARYRIELLAADPRRYGDTHTFGPSSSVSSVAHDGNFPAAPILTVAGSSGGGYTVSKGTRDITVTEPLVSGHPHTIDLATGTLTVDGDRVIGGFSVYEPWEVPVGSSVTVTVTAGTVEVEVVDTYI